VTIFSGYCPTCSRNVFLSADDDGMCPVCAERLVKMAEQDDAVSAMGGTDGAAAPSNSSRQDN
jgi:hypothetical protein